MLRGRSGVGCGVRWRRRCPGCAARRAGTRPAMTSSSRSTNTVSPSVIGFRASDAVVMAGLRDLVSHRGGRASAAARMAGDCEWIGRRKLAGGHVIQSSAQRGAIAPVKPPGWGGYRDHRWNAPCPAIGSRASDAVVMADLRDPLPSPRWPGVGRRTSWRGLRGDRGDPVVLCSTVACRPVRALSRCCPHSVRGGMRGQRDDSVRAQAQGHSTVARGGQRWR